MRRKVHKSMFRMVVWGTLVGTCLWSQGAWSNIVGKTVCGIPPDEHVIATFQTPDGKWNAYRPGYDHYRDGYETEEEAIGRKFLSAGRSGYGVAQFACHAIVTPRPAYPEDAMPGKLYRLGVKEEDNHRERFSNESTRQRVSVEAGVQVAASPPKRPPEPKMLEACVLGWESFGWQGIDGDIKVADDAIPDARSQARDKIVYIRDYVAKKPFLELVSETRIECDSQPRSDGNPGGEAFCFSDLVIRVSPGEDSFFTIEQPSSFPGTTSDSCQIAVPRRFRGR